MLAGHDLIKSINCNLAARRQDHLTVGRGGSHNMLLTGHAGPGQEGSSPIPAVLKKRFSGSAHALTSLLLQAGSPVHSSPVHSSPVPHPWMYGSHRYTRSVMQKVLTMGTLKGRLDSLKRF